MRRIVVDARAFSDAMAKVSRVLKKSPLPILGEICVSVRDGICTLTATDLETWITARLPAQGDDLTFVFNRTKDVMKALAHMDGELVMELTERAENSKEPQKLRLYCAQRLAEYEVSSIKDYPEMVMVEADKVFRANAEHLLESIERVRYATMKPTTNTKPFNTCVQFKGQRVFSLDGYRMACDTQEGVTFPVPFLCYGSSLAYLKVFGKSEVTVQVGTRWVLFTDGEASLCVRRQGVDTFDVDAALPRQYQETVTVRTAEFIRELNYLKECASGFTKPYVRFTGNQLTMAVPGGKFRTGIQVSGRGSLSLGFDLRYMLDALKQFKDAPEIRVKLSGIFSPIVIEAEGRDDFALVLPVRLKEEMAA